MEIQHQVYGDINVTKRLEEAAKILGIELLDHIVIGDGNFESIFRLRQEKEI